jgi:hypothetical protein
MVHALSSWFGSSGKGKDEGSTNASVIVNDVLRHVTFAEVRNEVIADDGVNCLEALARSTLVLSGNHRGEWVENFGAAGSSDGSHDCE